MRSALDPPESTLIAIAAAWLVLFVVLAVVSLGPVSFLVALVWALVLLYLVAVGVYAYAREEDSPVKRWARAAMDVPRSVLIGLLVAWLVLTVVLLVFVIFSAFGLSGLAFPLGFAWAVIFVYLLALTLQDLARQQEEPP